MPSEFLLLESGDRLLLESGDRLLLESSTVDQTVTLPVVDDGTVLAPDVYVAGSIALPLIDDGGALPPLVFEDKLLDLPLVDDAQVFGPGITQQGSIDLPLVDDAATFGPSVFVAQTSALPLIDGGDLFGPDVYEEQALTLPLLEAGWPFAPVVTGQIVAGLVAKAGGTVLSRAFAKRFLDELSDTGSWSLRLQNGDADLSLVDFDDVVTFELDSRPVFAGLIEGRRNDAIAPGEEHDQTTAVSGRSTLALLDQATIEPARGLGALPVEVSRSFSWVSVDFDDTHWPASKRTLSPSHGRPEWWPDPTAWWVWANRPDVTPSSAPGGLCLFRHTFTVAEDCTLAIFAGLDNYGPMWFDGAKVVDTDNDSESFIFGDRVPPIEVTAGEHTIALSCLNTGRHGGVIFAVYTLDADGLLDELVTHSDSTLTKCLPYPYPYNMPGFTAGRAIRLAVEEAQALGQIPGVTLGFTDFVDSDGEEWTEVAEITIDIGRTVLDLVASLADWLIDVQMAPGSKVLRAWNFGTRGRTPGVALAVTGDPDTSEVEAASHDGRFTRANRFLIRYRGGLTQVIDQDSIDAHGMRTQYLDLGDVETETAAKREATRRMALRKNPSYATTVALAPVSARPYDAFDNGDTIDPTQTGAPAACRVRAIEVEENDDGDVDITLRLNDVRREAEERHDIQFRSRAPGGLYGGARLASRSGQPLPNGSRISPTTLMEFSTDSLLVPSVADISRPADKSGNLIEVYGELSQPGAEVQFRVLMNGVSLGTVTIPAGETSGSIPLAIVKVRRDVDKFRPEIVAAGGGATGLDVQLRGI